MNPAAREAIDALHSAFPNRLRCGPVRSVHSHGGTVCPLCSEDMEKGVMLLSPPYMGQNRHGDKYCRHVYTTKVYGFFYWNANGTTCLVRPDGWKINRCRDGAVLNLERKPPQNPCIPPWVGKLELDDETSARFEELLLNIYHVFHPPETVVGDTVTAARAADDVRELREQLAQSLMDCATRLRALNTVTE